MTETVNNLKTIAADESMPIVARRSAAEHYVSGVAEGVPIPAADDSEVLARMQPQDNGWMVQLGFSVEPLRKAARESGISVDGYPLDKAQRIIQEKRQVRAVRTIAADESEHDIVRTAACAWLMEHAPIAYWKWNGYTPVTLLEKIKAGAEAA